MDRDRQIGRNKGEVEGNKNGRGQVKGKGRSRRDKNIKQRGRENQ